MTRVTKVRLLVLIVLWSALGCDPRSVATDAMSPPDRSVDDAGKADSSDAAPTGDTRDDLPRDDARVFDHLADAAQDEAPGPRDASADDGAATLPDVEVEGVDVTTPDEGAVAFDVGPDCTVARFGGPFDATVVCSPRRSRPCTCADGRAGAETCLAIGTWGACVCTSSEGLVWDDQILAPVTTTPIPWIGRPRLLAPLSGTRVTSTRPTLRWLLPAGLTRARVELCADRVCARMVQQQEVSGAAWRSASALPPGVMFWRVRGLGADGAVRWTSATWEFVVGRRDRGVDISFGMLRDFNGDGYDDAAVSGSVENGLLVYTGSSTGIDERRVLVLSPPLSDGELQYGERFSVGDVNGDGLADLAIGAYDHHPGIGGVPATSTQIPPGRVFLYLGNRACVLSFYQGVYQSANDVTLRSYGVHVSIGADFNGDGYGDMVATGDGGAQLHLGGPSGIREAPTDVAQVAGKFVRAVGDLNGDGYSDLVMQHRPSMSREIRDPPFLVAYGNPEARLALRVQVVDAWMLFNRASGHNARGGDFNEDGYGDVAVSGDGTVAIFYGSPFGIGAPTPLEVRYAGPDSSPRARYGGELSVGDFDGDGHLELAVSQPTAPAVLEPDLRYGPGMLHFYTREAGRTTLGATTAFSITGSPPGGIGFGHPTMQGDLNGDGGDDLTIGAGRIGPMMGNSQLWIYHGGAANWQRAPTRVIIRGYAFQHAE